MAILYGTTSSGETLPVQVNEAGQLVSQGLEGPPGPEGPQGIQGPPGPAAENTSAISSIQHVSTKLNIGQPQVFVSISFVDVSRSVIQYNGQWFEENENYGKRDWHEVSLKFDSASRVKVQRQTAVATSHLEFTVIEYN